MSHETHAFLDCRNLGSVVSSSHNFVNIPLLNKNNTSPSKIKDYESEDMEGNECDIGKSGNRAYRINESQDTNYNVDYNIKQS